MTDFYPYGGDPARARVLERVSVGLQWGALTPVEAVEQAPELASYLALASTRGQEFARYALAGAADALGGGLDVIDLESVPGYAAGFEAASGRADMSVLSGGGAFGEPVDGSRRALAPAGGYEHTDALERIVRARYPEFLTARTSAVDEARIEREYAQDVAGAVQLATDEEVAYGPGGDVRLLRDPYDILADHNRALPPTVATVIAPTVGERLSQARAADAGWEGRLRARAAGVLFPDMLDRAVMTGIDRDARINLDDVADDDDAVDVGGAGSGDDLELGS